MGGRGHVEQESAWRTNAGAARALLFLHLLAILLSTLGLGLACTAWAAEYTGVAPVFEFGMGARPLALGGAYTGLASDESALSFNPAGLAWQDGIVLGSSYEHRISGADFGSLALCLPPLGIGIQYLHFGGIPVVDDTGAIIGQFAYTGLGFSASLGVKLEDLPLLREWRGSRQLASGLRARVFVASTIEPASGVGATIDLPLLFRAEPLSVGNRTPLTLGVGVVLENLLSWPIHYESGHTEDWPLRVVVGVVSGIADYMVVAIDATSRAELRFGVELVPMPALAVRVGARHEGLWMWSLGVGVQVDHLRIDLAYVNHRELGGQVRGSVAIQWHPRNDRED